MPRHLATLLSAAVLVMAGCDSAPPHLATIPMRAPMPDPTPAFPGMRGRPTGGRTEEAPMAGRARWWVPRAAR